MNRRDFFRRAAAIAAGVVAADQFEILERLNHRKVFSGIDWVRRDPVTGQFADSHSTLVIVERQLSDEMGRVWRITAVDPAKRTITFEPPNVRLSEDDFDFYANQIVELQLP